MFMLDTMEKALVLAFLVTSMLSIGMQTHTGDLRMLLASKSFLLRILLANFLVVPMAGVAIAYLVPMQPPMRGALLLLACTPGGLSSLQFTGQVKGIGAMAGAILLLLSVLAVFVSPWFLQLVLPGSVKVVVPFGRALLFLVFVLLLPLLAGMFLLGRMPAASMKLAKPVALVGVVAFVAFMVVTSSSRKSAAADIGLPAVIGMLLFILASMVIGWFMGGPTRELRQLLASATSMRNAALCLAIVHASAPGHPVLVPLIAFSLLMVPPNMLFTIYSAARIGRLLKKKRRESKIE